MRTADADGREVARPEAWLELPGSGTAPVEVEVSFQPRGARVVRALVALLGSWALIPLVFFVPPHLPWVLAAFFGGLFLAWRFWRGDYLVRSFRGDCPRCGTVLELKPGTRIRGRHTLDCYACHRHPDLVLTGADG